ncbi:hypothetical protein HDV00_003835 [Rhizophlyctis rosea]|nr:hypothetical protein HDV00_003835 [Rhizophlyctis rosea]
MSPGVEKLTLVVDYEGISIFNATPLSVSKQVLDIIQSHYPERLGLGICINPTWYIWTFFKIITPLMDPVTRAKIQFVDLKKQNEMNQKESAPEGLGGYTNIRNHISADMLPQIYGGGWDYEFKHEEYWKELNDVIGRAK